MRKSLVAAMLAASALVLTACAMPADDPNYNAVDAGGGAVDESAAAVSQAALQAALAAPTSIGVDTPLSAAPAKGATIVNLTTGSTYAGVFDKALDEAAQTLGWKVETVPVSLADPTTASTAFADAVAKKPAGIRIDGSFADALAADLPSAQTAGIPVICTGCSGEPANGITDTSIDGTEQNIAWGDIMASYVIANQYAGEDAGVQIIPVPGGAVSDFNTEFNDSLLSQCRNCAATVSTLDPTTTDLTDPAAVQAFISSEMSTSLGAWALLDSGALSEGVADAIANDPTLLTPVVLIGRGAAASDIASLQALGGAAPVASAEASASAAPSAAPSPSAVPSAEASAAASGAASGEAVATGSRTPEEAAALQAWLAIPQPVMAWRVIDQFARIIGGGEPVTGPLPSQLLTGGNAADAVVDADGNFIGIADYQDQFKALWGVK